MSETAAPHGVYPGTPQKVVFGPGTISDLAGHLAELGVKRPMIVCGSTVAASPLVDQVRSATGLPDVHVFAGGRPHAPRSAIRNGLKAFRECGADSLISVGGSSPVEVMRGIALLDATGLDFEELLDYPRMGHTPMVPLIAVTTTLSQAEFSYVGSATNDDGAGEKFLWFDWGLMPKLVILDAELTIHTPERLWLSTGIKALDTSVDLYMEFLRPQPFWDGLLNQAIPELVHLLRQSRENPESIEIRQRLQVAAWCGEFPRFHLPADLSLPKASRWFGAVARHQLGGKYDIPHGELAGIIFPSALRFHADECAVRQDALARILGGSDRFDLPSIFADLVEALGLPTKLTDVGVPRSDYDSIVEAMLHEDVIYGADPAQLEGRRRSVSEALTAMLQP